MRRGGSQHFPTPVGRQLVAAVLLLMAAACTGMGAGDLQAGPPFGPEVEEAASTTGPADSGSTGTAPTPAAEPSAADGSPVPSYLEDPQALELGRRYFRAVCTGYCHTTQSGVTREAPDLFDCEWRHGEGDGDLYRVVAEGVPNTEMLPFGDKLDDDILWKIIAYLRSASRCG